MELSVSHTSCRMSQLHLPAGLFSTNLSFWQFIQATPTLLEVAAYSEGVVKVRKAMWYHPGQPSLHCSANFDFERLLEKGKARLDKFQSNLQNPAFLLGGLRLILRIQSLTL